MEKEEKLNVMNEAKKSNIYKKVLKSFSDAELIDIEDKKND